jgi:hypothetical protein
MVLKHYQSKILHNKLKKFLGHEETETASTFGLYRTQEVTYGYVHNPGKNFNLNMLVYMYSGKM